jgi:RNA polymerase sigma-70 factor (ECF subfamily)
MAPERWDECYIPLLMGDVTRLLGRWNRGDAEAFDALMPLVYAELRRLADHYMAHEQRGHTLQPTALVHEAYIRLANVRQGRFENRVHFYGAAAQAMRRILVDFARQRQAVKRGQNATMLDIDAMPEVGIEIDHDVVALDDALNRLARIAPRAAEVVQLRYFGGLSIEEVAEVLEIGAATVKRHWAFARAWLYRALAAPTR